jgi:pimeloyl-ACP methyl ester carboxylesterase
MKWQRTPAPAGPGGAEGANDPDDLAPSAWRRFREVAWHFPRMLSGLGPLGPRGPEDGPPVLVIPGFFGTDRTTMDLRRALARAGWRAHPWLLGINMGAKKNTLELLCKRLKDLEDPRKVLVVGWSLGGMFARQLAHKCPDKVRAVVTLASPFSGDLKTNTNVREIYERVAGHDVNEPPFPRMTGKPPVPTLALWGRRDGIVAPSAARGLENEVDKAVEIDTNHMGFAVYRPALSRVVDEIRVFLTEAEGRPPELQPRGGTPVSASAALKTAWARLDSHH